MVSQRAGAPRFVRLSAWVIGTIVTLVAAVDMVAGTIFLHEVNYNEGWNIYNAIAFRTGTLYPAHFGWTSNNYPLLSFALMAELHRLTHDYLYTARILSLVALVAICIGVTKICQLLECGKSASLLAGMFCFSLFVLNTTGSFASAQYIGADDPTMLALAVAVAGILLYLHSRSGRHSLPLLLAAAFLLALSLSIKQTFLEIPAVLFIDFLFRNRKLALLFLASIVTFTAASYCLQRMVAGSGFFPQLLAPRTYSSGRALETFMNVFGPMLFPSMVAIVTAIIFWKNPTQRIASLLFAGGLAMGCFTGRAEGVSYNCFFFAMVAMSLLMGLWLSKVDTGIHEGRLAFVITWSAPVLFLWFLVPLILFGNWNPLILIDHGQKEQSAFHQQVALLGDIPGPALCESLLRCYAAGKPYVYDPFNATRLIYLGKLDEKVLVASLAARHFKVIELSDPVEVELTYRSEHFTPNLLRAIEANYTLAYQHGRESIYRPK